MNDFFDRFYSIFYQPGNGFMDSVLESSLYGILGTSLLVITFLSMAFFYYVNQNPRYSKLSHWFLVGIIAFVLNAIIAYFYTFYEIDFQLTGEFSTEYVIFSLLHGSVAFGTYILFSLLFRFKSANARHIPFRCFIVNN